MLLFTRLCVSTRTNKHFKQELAKTAKERPIGWGWGVGERGVGWRESAEGFGNFHIFLTIPEKLCCDYREPHVKNSPAADAN